MDNLLNIIQKAAAREKLVQEKLSYDENSFSPVLSENAISLHYGKLAKGYVDRYNNQEGDDDFNYGGATLHNIYFPQLMPLKTNNKPSGKSEVLIDIRYGNFDKFKEKFEEIALSIQGSGWVYLDYNGDIKIIHNHEYKKNMKIALLIDMWEHSYILDYHSDKKKYLNNHWRIINWSIVNDRLQGK
jgi:superoxide dismutase, Fe-Mn family